MCVCKLYPDVLIVHRADVFPGQVRARDRFLYMYVNFIDGYFINEIPKSAEISLSLVLSIFCL